MITDYILSPADVRAVLGLPKIDLEDETIKMPVFEYRLQETLYSLHPNFATLMVGYKDIDEAHQLDPTNPPLTPTQKRLRALGQMYATYALALIIAPTVPVFALKKETDGRAAGERMPNAFDALMDYLNGVLSTLQGTILDLLEEEGEEVIRTPYKYISMSVGLAVDPVTGE